MIIALNAVPKWTEVIPINIEILEYIRQILKDKFGRYIDDQRTFK